MPKQYLIGIDPGMNVGYAKFSDIKTLMNYGTLKINRKQKQYLEDPLDVLMTRVATMFSESASFADHCKYEEKICVIEGTFIGPNKKVAMDLAENKGRIKSIAQQFGFRTEEIHPSHWQRKMNLNDVTAAYWAKGTYPHFYGDKHAACAVAICWCWLNEQFERELLGL